MVALAEMAASSSLLMEETPAGAVRYVYSVWGWWSAYLTGKKSLGRWH
jgi:hypothetical protein